VSFITVILLLAVISANDEKELMMKGVKHGACDYLVKPARLEQLRTIWLHVVRKSVNDKNTKTSGANDAIGKKLQSGDGENSEKDGAKHTEKHSKKNKKEGNGAEEDKDGMSTQKKQRIKWSGELHRKFIEAINQIGMDRKNSISFPST
jgi:two-component response regulator (ARR-B family)